MPPDEVVDELRRRVGIVRDVASDLLDLRFRERTVNPPPGEQRKLDLLHARQQFVVLRFQAHPPLRPTTNSRVASCSISHSNTSSVSVLSDTSPCWRTDSKN